MTQAMLCSVCTLEAIAAALKQWEDPIGAVPEALLANMRRKVNAMLRSNGHLRHDDLESVTPSAKGVFKSFVNA
jgi:hypothetical protein